MSSYREVLDQEQLCCSGRKRKRGGGQDENLRDEWYSDSCCMQSVSELLVCTMGVVNQSTCGFFKPIVRQDSREGTTGRELSWLLLNWI